MFWFNLVRNKHAHTSSKKGKASEKKNANLGRFIKNLATPFLNFVPVNISTEWKKVFLDISWRSTTVKMYQFAKFKAKIPNLKKCQFSEMVFFLATLHLAVTFAQAVFNKNGKTLLWTTHTRKDKILKAPGCRFSWQYFWCKNAFFEKVKIPHH